MRDTRIWKVVLRNRAKEKVDFWEATKFRVDAYDGAPLCIVLLECEAVGRSLDKDIFALPTAKDYESCKKEMVALRNCIEE